MGPIPEGYWWMYPPGYDRRHPGWAPLSPFSSTKTYNRTGFYIHGYGKTEGCIAIVDNACRDMVMQLLKCENGGTLNVSR